MGVCMNDTLAFLSPLALLVQIVTRGMLEDLVVDALFFVRDFRLVVVGLSFVERPALLHRVVQDHGASRGNDRARRRRSGLDCSR